MQAFLMFVAGIIAAGIAGTLARPVVARVQEQIASFVLSIKKWAIWGNPHMATMLAQHIYKSIYRDTSAWASIVNEYMKQMFPEFSNLKAEELVSPKDFADSASTAVAKGFLQKIIDYVAPQTQITPEGALNAAARFFDVNLRFQMSAWVLHWISDTFSLGSMKSFKDLPNAIMWSFGLGWLSWLVMGTPFKKAIADPLEVYYNRVYKTEKPTLSQFLEYKYFTAKEMDINTSGLEDYGFNSDNAAIVMSSFEKKMTPSDGEKLYKYGVWDENTYKMFLRHLGYNKHHIDYLVKLAKLEETSSYKKDTVEVLIDLAISGYVNMEDVYRVAQEIGMDNNEVDALYNYRYFKRVRDNTLSKTDILSAYTRGLIDESTAREYLRLAGYFDEDIDILLSLQIKTLSVPQIRQLYIRGVISKGEAIDRITRLGYSKEDAELLISVFDPSLTPGQIADTLFNGYISIPQAIDMLKSQGFSDENAQITIFSYVTPTIINRMFTLYNLGVMSREEVEERLKFLRIPEKEISELFSSGGKRLTLKQLQDLFFSQQIHRTDVYQKLLELGYDEQTAKAILDTYFKPYEVMKYDPSTGQFIKTGQIWE